MKTANIISSFIAIGIAIFFFIMTFQFSDVKVQDTGPAFLPRLYIGGIVVLSLILLINTLKNKFSESEEKSNVMMVLFTMALIALLVFLIPKLGFYIATPIIIFIFLKVFKEKSVVTLLSLPIGIILFIYFVFEKTLKVPIPKGIFF